MKVLVNNNNIVLENVRDFNLGHIFECGQAFRFYKLCDDTYIGVAYGKALKISQAGNTVTLYDTSYEDFTKIWYEFFDFGTDYGKIKKLLSCDNFMKEATSFGYGIRILKQDLWETIVSFIISASNNVPRIKGIIERLCTSFGDKIEYMDNTYYSFPSPQRLAQLSLQDLSIIKAGFRDRYILDAAKKVVLGKINLDEVKQMQSCDAKSTLMTINGVGNKVSDCILLFGLNKYNSFPVDVWIKRIMEYCYFSEEQPINAISQLANDKFKDLGGFAQQYLFFWARENKIGT